MKIGDRRGRVLKTRRMHLAAKQGGRTELDTWAPRKAGSICVAPAPRSEFPGVRGGVRGGLGAKWRFSSSGSILAVSRNPFSKPSRASAPPFLAEGQTLGPAPFMKPVTPETVSASCQPRALESQSRRCPEKAGAGH